MSYDAEEYFFAQLPIGKGEKNVIEKIVLSIYKDNIQMRKKEDLSIFHKINPTLLWFLNTTDCRRQLALTYFADDFAYRNLALKISCCNNYLYNLYKSVNTKDGSGVPKWKLYNVIIRHFVYYLETNKWYRH